jgi:hypothetical protein
MEFAREGLRVWLRKKMPSCQEIERIIFRLLLDLNGIDIRKLRKRRRIQSLNNSKNGQLEQGQKMRTVLILLCFQSTENVAEPFCSRKEANKYIDIQ